MVLAIGACDPRDPSAAPPPTGMPLRPTGHYPIEKRKILAMDREAVIPS
jgi:hypothetical protein